MPPKLQELRENYLAAIERSNQPITAKYITELERVKAECTRFGDPVGAHAAASEIARLKGEPVPGVDAASKAAADVEFGGALLKATSWREKGAEKWAFKFDSATSVTVNWGTGIGAYEFKVNEGRRTVTFGPGPMVLKFNKDLTEAKMGDGRTLFRDPTLPPKG